MPELHSPLASRYPVGRHGDGLPAVTLQEVRGFDLVQAACWRGRFAALAECVESVLGLPPPAPGQCRRDGAIEILHVAPDRLWCLGPTGDGRLTSLRAAIAADTGCTTELGHSHVRVRIGGPASRHLLNQEIAIDLDPGEFPAERIARTVLHHVPATLQCIDAAAGTFDLYLPRTFAASTWEYLLDLATGHGHEILPAADHPSPGNPA